MVDETEILKAIQVILERGENPTYESILSITGGSKREVSKILIPWREAKKRKVEKKVRPLVERYQGLNFVEKREFLLETDLMEATPTELKRRESVGSTKKKPKNKK